MIANTNVEESADEKTPETRMRQLQTNLDSLPSSKRELVDKRLYETNWQEARSLYKAVAQFSAVLGVNTLFHWQNFGSGSPHH